MTITVKIDSVEKKIFNLTEQQRLELFKNSQQWAQDGFIGDVYLREISKEIDNTNGWNIPITTMMNWVTSAVNKYYAIQAFSVIENIQIVENFQ